MGSTIAPVATRSLVSMALPAKSVSRTASTQSADPVDTVQLSTPPPPPDESGDVSAGAQGIHLDGEHRGVPPDASSTVDPNTGATVYAFEDEGVAYTMEHQLDGTWVTTYERDGVLYTETLTRTPDGGWTEEQVVQSGDVVTTTTTTSQGVEGDVEQYLPEGTSMPPDQVREGERGETRELTTTMTVTSPEGTTLVGTATTYEQQVFTATGDTVPVSPPEYPLDLDVEGDLSEEESGQFLSVTVATSGDQTVTTVGTEDRAVWNDGGTLRTGHFYTMDGDQVLVATHTVEAVGLEEETFLDLQVLLRWNTVPELEGELEGTDRGYRSTTTTTRDGGEVKVEEYGDLEGDGTAVRALSLNGHLAATSLNRTRNGEVTTQSWFPGSDVSIVERPDGTATLMVGEETLEVDAQGMVWIDGKPYEAVKLLPGETAADALFREMQNLRTMGDAAALAHFLPPAWRARLFGLGAGVALHSLLQSSTWHSLDSTVTALGSMLGESGALAETLGTGRVAAVGKVLGVLGAVFFAGAAGYELSQGDYESAAVNGAVAVGMTVGVFNPLAGAAIVGAAMGYTILRDLLEDDPEPPPVVI
ncbi:MAG: hypothetical protein AMXMBFR33_09630 [Candidatus Xenobia bacterium]